MVALYWRYIDDISSIAFIRDLFLFRKFSKIIFPTVWGDNGLFKNLYSKKIESDSDERDEITFLRSPNAGIFFSDLIIPVDPPLSKVETIIDKL